MKKFLVIFSLVVLLLFRLFLAVNAKHGDMYNNIDWGRATVELGPSEVYNQPQSSWPHSWPNQPPGSLVWHGISTIIYETKSAVFWFLNDRLPIFPSALIWWWEQHGELLSIKLPSIFADFATAAAIYYYGKSRRRIKMGIVAAYIYLLNPAIWYNSSFWGQTDPIVAAFSTWSLVLLLTNKLTGSAILLGLSLITKASWAPVIPLYLIYWFRKHPQSWLKLLLIPLTMLVVAWPFHPHLDLIPWLFDLFINRILPGESAFITVLAFNFWNLVFGPAFLPAASSFFGLPANIVGWLIVGIYLFFLLNRLWRNPQPKNFLLITVLLFFAVFLFAPKMIHRYLFPVFPPLTLLFISNRHRTIWFITGLLSACFLVNIYYLWWAPGIPALIELYTPFFTKIISIIYLSVFLYLNVKKA